MPGMGPDYDYDAKGDVMMAMPQPIFEYEDKVAEQCGATGEVEAAVARSVRSTIEPRVLEHVATYILQKKVSSVTDDRLIAEMRRKVGTMMNDRVPDVTQLFVPELKMDLRKRMKLRYKFLLSNLTPEMLKIDLTRLVDLTDRGAKADDLALHDPMVERATRCHSSSPSRNGRTSNNREGLISLEPPMTVVAAGGSTMTCHEKVYLDLQIVTGVGTQKLENIECLVLEAPEEGLLIRTTLQSIGVDLDDIFKQLAQQHIEEAEAQADAIPTDHVEVLGADDGEEITPLLHTLVDDAIGAGFDATLADDVRELVVSYSDIFRLRIGRDEPADVQPLDVRLVADAQPYRSGVRRCPEAQLQFLGNYVRELEAAGLVERNNNSRWSCPALPVAKQDTSEFRITIDYRPANNLTVSLAGAASNLSVVVESVLGAYGFGTFDFHKSFWQMPLHPRCQEMFSFVTEDGVFTPTMVPQGASDSAVHFQAQMNDVLKDNLFHSVLVSIDDVLLYATTPGAFLENLSKFFSILRQRNLKLNAKKGKLFARRVKWCGKVPLSSNSFAPSTDLMIDFARTVVPLQEKLEHVMRERGRRKSQLSGAKLSWPDADKLAFQQTLEMVEPSSKLIFPDKGATVCLFSDASLTGYSIVITQVPELLYRRKGRYPIVKACDDLDYMLEREKGFHINCDHSTLIQLFSPDREVKQHVKAQTLSERRPLQDESFTWPTQAQVVEAQKKYRSDAPVDATTVDGATEVGGKLGVPRKAKSLAKRLFVIAHCGSQGHRGVHVMVELLDRHFALDNTSQSVVRFINDCLLFKHVKGGTIIQRDWTVVRTVAARNACMHMDYLYLADSQTAVEALLDWHKRFGIPEMWIFDNGTHFKFQVMEALADRFGVTHSSVPVYFPWINGTVERLNRAILQVLRVMLLENHLDTQNWVHLLPLVQANLNHSPALSLGNCAPVELFTGLPTPSSLDVVVIPGEQLPRSLPLDRDNMKAAIEDFRRSLHGLHRVVRDRREQRRTAAMARSSGAVCNFSEGDYLLWSRVGQRLRGNKLLTEAFYHGDLDVTAEIREHVSLQGIVLEERDAVDHRHNAASGELELLVAWRGLQDIENFWEPARSIKHDVPALEAKYAQDNDVTELM
ncbi:Hypothetical protein PHPALM_16894 [Phytophthora palmivora]|uniref:Reverse transcriptase n=1 Tax=Phytophthora palmivora TaxID=4796 RepID=A0A2P4XNR0_9STRA|nr:Hypothetical protein PHPALM_16894 [Phytophthora palmivora]